MKDTLNKNYFIVSDVPLCVYLIIINFHKTHIFVILIKKKQKRWKVITEQTLKVLYFLKTV